MSTIFNQVMPALAQPRGNRAILQRHPQDNAIYAPIEPDRVVHFFSDSACLL